MDISICASAQSRSERRCAPARRQLVSLRPVVHRKIEHSEHACGGWVSNLYRSWNHAHARHSRSPLMRVRACARAALKRYPRNVRQHRLRRQPQRHVPSSDKAATTASTLRARRESSLPPISKEEPPRFERACRPLAGGAAQQEPPRACRRCWQAEALQRGGGPCGDAPPPWDDAPPPWWCELKPS